MPPPVEAPLGNGTNWRLDTSHLNMDATILTHAGDDATVHSTVAPDQDEDAFWLYFPNINGLKLMAGDEILISAMGVISSFRVSMVCLAETNVNWKRGDGYKRVYIQLSRCFQHVKMSVSSTVIPMSTLHQPGGNWPR